MGYISSPNLARDIDLMARDKHNFDKNTAATSEADFLCSFDKYGEPSDWTSTIKSNSNNKNKKEVDREFTCGCGLTDDLGVALSGVRAQYQVLRGRKVSFCRTKATLFKNENRADLRVIQIENRQPLIRKGGVNHEDWPHLHYGQNVFKLGFDEGKEDMTPQETIDYFNKRAKIHLSPNVVCDFDNNNFKLV